MAKDPKTGKLIRKILNVTKAFKKKGGGKQKKANMSKEEKAKYKTGKRNEDSDSDFSYRSVYTPGGTRKVRRRKRLEDGTYASSESYHSSQDEDGEARRRRRRQDRDHEGSAHSYYSVTSPGGTRQVRKKKKRADGTYSDSESCASSNTEETKTKASKSDEDSDCSYNSDLSEGGTRTVTKKKRLRDEDGNIIGYGEAEVVDDPENQLLLSDTGSISPRRGSISDGSEGAYDRYMSKKLQQLEDVANTMQEDEEREQEEERKRKMLEDEHNRLQQRVFDPTWPGTKPTDKNNIELPNFDDQYKRLGGPRDRAGKSREKMGGSREKKGPKLANMTEEEKAKYFEEQEKKEQEEKEREKKEREKREKRDRQNLRREKTQDNIEEERKRLFEEREKRRESIMSQHRLTTPLNGKPQSMVTYEKGTARDINTPIQKYDNRQQGLSHSDWTKKTKDVKGNTRKGRDSTAFDYQPSKLNALNRKYGSDKKTDDNSGRLSRKENSILNDVIRSDKDHNDNKDNNDNKTGEWTKFEVDENGNVLLKPGEKIDINKMTDEDLIKLGIDPSLPKSEILKKLREKLGDDIVITEGDRVISANENGEEEDSLLNIMNKQKKLAEDKNIKGVRRVNLLLRSGGSALRLHMQKVVDTSHLKEYNYSTDIDERDSSIDFMCHYRLVNPDRLDSYAKAFVVEDGDLDTVITFQEIRTALEGVPSVQHITNKQVDYVFKVLHIDDATLVTFRMFAVITALCERVTAMDSLSKHLMEICNLADIERKLNLYQAMFYHNIPSDRTTNFITSDSLKIELIAGGLNWQQQKYIMEKMEPNDWGEISFIDYMCYIPLFMSMHDNICDNPLDMSDTKYQMPPRKRPPSVQRDMNPLGQPLSQNSTFLLKKQARDLMEGKLDKSILHADKIELLHKYAKLPEIPKSRESKKAEETDEEEKMDLIY
ncbi:trichohyalin [Patella vulgata]|uniref:trichohyalin n=1 Tax=Patella vulgata TaxID=6465 RepID=UPI0024A7B56C|nr:trichohyalin [Patella vulgata]